jgi:hypothetical protein
MRQKALKYEQPSMRAASSRSAADVLEERDHHPDDDGRPTMRCVRISAP